MFFYYAQSIEDLSESLFKELGFSIFLSSQHTNSERSSVSTYFDIGIEKDNRKFAVEVKSSSSPEYRHLKDIERAISTLVENATAAEITPVLMVYSYIPKSDKDTFKNKYTDLKILDLSNILYLARQTYLFDNIVAMLPFSVEDHDYIPVSPDTFELISASSIAFSKGASSTMPYMDLSKCKPGKKDALRFEKKCTETLKRIFSDDLTLWKEHPLSNSDLYQFDLLCRIKDNNKESFWNIAENFFNSKYIVFEFKNYSEEITQKEIYTTERYLYSKALRNVSIVIARNGYDAHAKWAAKGSLREYGKLIILLKIEDINRMIDLKNEYKDPSTVLLDKLDELLIELEK